MSPPIPINEQARLEALKAYNILDTGAEEAFDNCTKLASQICGTPISVITLVDESRQWFKSQLGLDVSETDRNLSFCAHAIINPYELFVVEDATKDPRFADNDLVVFEPKIRFYAGVPLVTPEGYGLGTLCVVDQKPRHLKPEQFEALKQLATLAQELLELRRVSFELVQTKHELQEASEQKMRKIANQAPGTLYQFQIASDGDVSFPFVSDGIADIHPGITSDMLINDPSLAFSTIHPNDLAGVQTSIQVSYESLTTWDEEFRIVLDDGSTRWHRGSAKPERLGDGTVTWYGFFQDITKVKLNQFAVERQLKRTALLNEIARTTIDRVDLVSVFQVALGQLEEQLPLDFSLAALYEATNTSLTFTTCGLKSCNLNAQLGFSPDQIIPIKELGLQSWLGGEEPLYYPDLTQFDQVFARKLTEVGVYSIITLPLLIPKAKPLGWLIVGREQIDAFTPRVQDFLSQVSEQVALTIQHIRLHEQLQTAYDALRQTQQALLKEERLSALGQMASGIAHDINNALVPIVGFTEIMLRRETNLSKKARRDLQRIKTAGQDISHIVTGIKNFYRPREVQETLFPVDLNQIVEEVRDLTRLQWQDIPRQVDISIIVETDLATHLPPIFGLESELREALTNLIINAVHAMPQGGTLTLRTSQAEQHLLLEAIDTGLGMDNETREHCLEPFYTTKGQEGTGLGLSMVYGVMQRHEGTIEIESTLGQGTTMRLLFPLPEGGILDDLSEREQEISLPPLRVLCIDDDPRVRELLMELLSVGGHQPTLADGGQVGIDAFLEGTAQGQSFDLVITDMGMPYVDGREVAEVIKQISPKTPIILLSGWGEQIQEVGKTPPGVDIVLSKPPTLVKLQTTLAKFVS